MDRSFKWTIALLSSATAAVGCGATSNSSAVSDVVVGPAPCGIGLPSAVQMSVVATFLDGTKQDVTADGAVVWSSDDWTIATVSASGVVAGANAGITGITASFQGVSSTDLCTVGP